MARHTVQRLLINKCWTVYHRLYIHVGFSKNTRKEPREARATDECFSHFSSKKNISSHDPYGYLSMMTLAHCEKSVLPKKIVSDISPSDNLFLCSISKVKDIGGSQAKTDGQSWHFIEKIHSSELLLSLPYISCLPHNPLLQPKDLGWSHHSDEEGEEE